MRLALISDIHGNFTALQAVLDDLRREQIDSFIFLGDAATGGPQPKQVVAALRKLGCPCVLGNHDQVMLDLDAAPHLQIPDTLIPALHWCARQLDDDDLEYLRSFHPTLEVSINENNKLLCYHGSPQSNIENIFATTPAEGLNFIFAGQVATLFAGGHTHIQMLRQHHGALIINPGSIGQPFKSTPMFGTAPTLLPWAEYAILEERAGIVSIDLRRRRYDLTEYRRQITASGNPLKDWLLQQYPEDAS